MTTAVSLAATYTVPTAVVLFPVMVVVCVPVWFAAKWLSDRLADQALRHYQTKLARLEAEIAAREADQEGGR